jgi:hypothetical protein
MSPAGNALLQGVAAEAVVSDDLEGVSPAT